jgi:membrane protease YdiL (CAAX protease family)
VNKTIFKLTELVFVFVLLPLLYYFHMLPGPKFVPLLAVFLCALVYLLRSPEFNRKELLFNGFPGWKGMMTRIVVGSATILLLTVLILPHQLFRLPRENPGLWGAIMVVYPIVSAFTQELIYRTFFFFRYRSLFPRERAVVFVNAGLFGFLHIIFHNWVAVICTTIMGLVWALQYKKNRSLLAVSIEHAILGNMVFTIGLGYYFYIPDFHP